MGVREECRDRRGDELLSFAEADDERAFVTEADEAVRLLSAERSKGIGPRELGAGAVHSFDEIAVVVRADQLGKDLCVGIGAELDEVAFQLGPQLRAVLDDPVEDDPDPTGGVAVRMSVPYRNRTVRRPTGVADAGLHRIWLIGRRAEIACRPGCDQPAVARAYRQ